MYLDMCLKMCLDMRERHRELVDHTALYWRRRAGDFAQRQGPNACLNVSVDTCLHKCR